MMRKTLFRRTGTIVLTLSTLTACQSTAPALPDPAEASLQTPAWAVAMQEPVEAIPLEPEGPALQAMTPTDVEAQDMLQGRGVPRGRPTDMTGRLPQAKRDQAKPRHDRPHPKHRANGGSGATRVVVQLQTPKADGEEAQAQTAPPKPAALAPLETLYRGGFDRDPARRLTQFGYRYFEQPAPPAPAGPVTDDYVIGVGDELRVTITGSFEAEHALEVDAEGRVMLPGAGPVPVAGVRMGEVSATLGGALRQHRKGFAMTVGLGRVRTIPIHVVGEVLRPGPVEVSARATLLDALHAAGGPTKTGTLRSIQWRRGGQAPRTIDLYEFLVDGQQPPRANLLPGDIIHVGPIGPTLGVAGYVQRPGIYELTGPLPLREALKLAGGFTPFTFTPRVQIEQTVDGRGRETRDVDMQSPDADAVLSNGELVLVGAVDDRLQPIVRVAGEVVRPGDHQYRTGLTVTDLVQLADGLTVDAYLPQAFISRQVGTPGVIDTVTDRVRQGTTRRVLVVDLGRAMRGDPEHDVALQPLDQLTVRSRAQATVRPTVQISGAVQAPGTYELTTGLRVSELVALAGNLAPDVFYDEAEVIRRHHHPETGQLDVKRYRFDLGQALEEGGRWDPVLQNGDRLIVRRMRQAQVTAIIDGQVRFPGEYVFPAGAKITDVIAAAGGLVDDADLRAAVFTRASVRRLQQARFKHLTERTQRVFEDTLRQMVQTGQPREGLAAKLALQDTEQLMDRMARSEATGRVVIPFTRADFVASPYNLMLEDGDRLVIPRRQQTVTVLGCVFTPNSFVADANLTVDQALERVGGPTEFADKDQVYVIRADGNVQSLAQRGRVKLRLDAQLWPGDVVLVPREAPERTMMAQTADTLVLLRHAVELGLLGSQVGNPINDFNFSSISDQGRLNPGIDAYQEAILDETRR